MPEDNTTHVLKIVGTVLAVLAAGSVVFILWRLGGKEGEAPAPAPETVTEESGEARDEETSVAPTGAPSETSEKAVVQIQAPAPAPLSESVESRIQAVADKIGSGELTREEGQRQINEILGI